MRDVKPELQPARSPDTWQGNNFYRHLNVIKGKRDDFQVYNFPNLQRMFRKRKSLYDVMQFEFLRWKRPRR